ncbi:MAG: hypothetical protein Q9M97_08025 [Candidatus Gracilibacteria bacterium]|nr:hypothetical protein [Candidatus Gracilibacteria bacterium]
MQLNQVPLTDNIVNINLIDFSKITFYTKEEFNDVLVNEYMYEIAHLLKYNYENLIDNSKYIKELKSKNLDLSFLKYTLIFMISRGIPQAVLLKDEFEIDTSDINIDIFLEGLVNGMNGLNDSELLGDYVKLYKNSQELLEAIGEKGDITLLSNLIYYYGLDFKKFDDDKIDIILLGFKYNLNENKFFDKINTIGTYNWFIICSELFENYELAYSKIQDIFNLTDDEKEKFEEFKQSHFFTSYQSEIQKILNLLKI